MRKAATSVSVNEAGRHSKSVISSGSRDDSVVTTFVSIPHAMQEPRMSIAPTTGADPVPPVPVTRMPVTVMHRTASQIDGETRSPKNASAMSVVATASMFNMSEAANPLEIRIPYISRTGAAIVPVSTATARRGTSRRVTGTYCLRLPNPSSSASAAMSVGPVNSAPARATGYIRETSSFERGAPAPSSVPAHNASGIPRRTSGCRIMSSSPPKTPRFQRRAGAFGSVYAKRAAARAAARLHTPGLVLWRRLQCVQFCQDILERLEFLSSIREVTRRRVLLVPGHRCDCLCDERFLFSSHRPRWYDLSLIHI